MIAVSVKDATLKVKNREIFTNIDIDLFEGENMTIFGGEDADLLLATIGGIILPSSGSIQLYGKDVVKYRRHLSTLVSYLPPNPYIPSKLKLREYIELSCRMRGLRNKEEKEKIKSVLEGLELAKLSESIMGRLGLAEKRMAAIASILASSSKLLLLSRPFENLPTHYRELVSEYIRKASKDGVTCILTSYTFDHLVETDRVAIMNNGRLVAQGILKDLTKIMIDEQYLLLKTMDTKAAIEKLSKFPTIKKLGLSRDGVIKLWLKDFDNQASSTIELLFSLNLGVKQISIERLNPVEALRQIYRKMMHGETS